MIGYALAVCVAMVGLLSLVALVRSTGTPRRRLGIHRELRETFESAAREIEPSAGSPRRLLVMAAGTGPQRAPRATGTGSQREPKRSPPTSTSRHAPSVGVTRAIALLEQSSLFERAPAPAAPARYPRASTPPPVVVKPIPSLARKLPRLELRADTSIVEPRRMPLAASPRPPVVPTAKPAVAPPPLPSSVRPLPSFIRPVVSSRPPLPPLPRPKR